MDAILNNPFRIFGLPTTSSDKLIAKRVSDLLIYAEMGKEVTYETDLPFIGQLDRSVEAVKLASKRIELAENKIFYSLLWFDFNDNIEKQSLEFLKNGDFKAAKKVLENEIYNLSPIVYSTDKTITYITKNFKPIFYYNKYSIIIGPPKSLAESIHTNISNNYIINISQEDGFVEIQEGKSEINITNNFQIVCKFQWLESYAGNDVSIELGFIDNKDLKCSVCISNKGTFSFFVSDRVQTESSFDLKLFSQKGSNYLALKKYDNFIEVIFNGISIYKMQNLESFIFSFLNFSGKQRILIEDLSITALSHRKVLGFDDEINELTFSYSKNISLVYLIEILKNGKVSSGLSFYFSIIGNFFTKPYFINYTKQIISDTYHFNSEVLFDIFVQEFYLSLHHLIDPNQDYSKLRFYNPFGKLSDRSKEKVIDRLKGSKPHIFENFIKEITQKRIEKPEKSHEFASDLKIEATYFFKWFSNFYIQPHRNMESRTLSDKVGNEILECSIAYYNSIFPKTIEHAKQSLKLLNWASDFAFNQELRERINSNISVLIKFHKIAENAIIDFDLKDQTRLSSHVINKNNPTDNNSKKAFLPKTNTIISKQSGYRIHDKPQEKQNSRNGRFLNYKYSYGILLFLFSILLLFFLFTPDKDKEKKALPGNNKISQTGAIPNINNSYLIPKETSKWSGNSLQNGDSPYDDFFGTGIYNYNSECWVTFKNGNSTDAIVCLENVTNGRTIRNEYIQAGKDFKMTNIPEGVYKVKVFYGNNWNPEKALNIGAIKGAFETDQSYSLSDSPNDLIRMKITETYNGIRYTTVEITLYTVSNGNMNQRNINSDEFFN